MWEILVLHDLRRIKDPATLVTDADDGATHPIILSLRLAIQIRFLLEIIIRPFRRLVSRISMRLARDTVYLDLASSAQLPCTVSLISRHCQLPTIGLGGHTRMSTRSSTGTCIVLWSTT